VQRGSIKPLALDLGVQEQGNDQTIETQNFAENKDKHHADKDSGLLHVGPDTAITDHANAVSGGKTRQADGETAPEMQETSKQSVFVRALCWGRQVFGDEDGNDEGVNGDDTRHDHGDQALHNEIWSKGTNTSNTDAGLGRAVGSTDACKAISG
jgi:hypothetical protein